MDRATRRLVAEYRPGKCYEPGEGEGAKLWAQIQERLRARPAAPGVEQEQDRYGKPYMAKPRLGQSGFRVAVMDAYGRRCAVTEEKTLPVLEAAHIRPYADGEGMRSAMACCSGPISIPYSTPVT